MLIKTKLRPKELNEFNRYFGDLKHSLKLIDSTTKKEDIQDGVVASKVLLTAEKLFIQKFSDEFKKIHNNALKAFEQDMNHVQKQIIEIFCELHRNEYNIIGKENVQYIFNSQSVEEIRRLIYFHLLSAEFIEAIRENKIYFGLQLEVADNESKKTIAYITENDDFSNVEFPADVHLQKMAEELKLTAEEKDKLKFYYLVILDILVHPFMQTSVMVILFRPLYWCLVKIIREMDADFKAFWQCAAAIVKEDYYRKEKAAEASYIELISGRDEKRGEELIKENYYYNMATGLIVSNELQIFNFLNLKDREEKNIVINEAVRLARNIIKPIEEDFKDFTPDKIFEPEENAFQLKEIIFFMSTFKFSCKKFEELFLSKGLKKGDWYFFRNLIKAFSEKVTDKAYNAYMNGGFTAVKEFNGLAVNYSLNSMCNANPDLLEFGKYTLMYSVSMSEVTDEQRLLEEACDEIIKLTGSKFKVNLNKDTILNSQKSKGVSPGRLRLFQFFEKII